MGSESTFAQGSEAILRPPQPEEGPHFSGGLHLSSSHPSSLFGLVKDVNPVGWAGGGVKVAQAAPGSTECALAPQEEQGFVLQLRGCRSPVLLPGLRGRAWVVTLHSQRGRVCIACWDPGAPWAEENIPLRFTPKDSWAAALSVLGVQTEAPSGFLRSSPAR